MNFTYPLKERPVQPQRDPNAIFYLLGLALIAGMVLALWTMV